MEGQPLGAMPRLLNAPAHRSLARHFTPAVRPMDLDDLPPASYRSPPEESAAAQLIGPSAGASDEFRDLIEPCASPGAAACRESSNDRPSTQSPRTATGEKYRRTLVRRIVDAVSRLAIQAGLRPSHRYLVTVRGRRTGRPRTTPVGLVHVGPDRWLVAPYGEVGWVRNVRAIGQAVIERTGKREHVRLIGVGQSEAGEVLKEYLKLEPTIRPFFRADVDDPPSEFAAEASDHPVFRIARLE